MRFHPPTLPVIAMLMAGCAADQAGTATTQAAPGTAILCDGTVYDLTRTLSEAEVQAFAGSWKGRAVGVAGRYKRCVDESLRRQHTLTDSSVRVKMEGNGHSCGQGNFEDKYVLPFASRLKGDGFYRRRDDGRQFAMFIDDTGQLKVIGNTAPSKTCWVATYRRVE